VNEDNKEVIEPPTKLDINYTREKMTHRWWFDETGFRQVIEHLKNYETASVEAVRILSLMAKTFWVETKESSGKKPEKNVSPVKIEKEDINQLMQCIQAVTESPQPLSSRLAQLLTYLLATVKQFVKLPEYFALMNHSALNSQISSYLDHADHHLNKQAWHTLYKIIKYNVDVLESWIEDGKSLKSLLGPLNVGSQLITIEYGFRYVTKMLNLPPRLKKGKVDKKSAESDVKLLVSYFITRSVFTHIHMIYQNLNKKSPGGAFNAAAKFYYFLIKEPALSKLYKDCLKNPQWKGDIEEISNVMSLKEEKSSKKNKERIMWE